MTHQGSIGRKVFEDVFTKIFYNKTHMTTQEIIEDTQKEIEAIQHTLNTQQTVACVHQLCHECSVKAISQQVEGEMLTAQLREKMELLNNLKSTL
jgi:hypothetical protein